LELAADFVGGALNKSADRHYLAALRAFAGDAALRESERAELSHLRDVLRISNEQGLKACRTVLEPIVQNVINRSLADGRLSPTEEAEIAFAAERLGVSFDWTGNSAAILESARTLWQIENGTLPIVGSPVNLHRGEICHGWLTAEATEIRERTVAVGYSGPSVRFRIMKGVYYNVGGYRVTRDRESDVTP
jgi:hypothetical protein